MLLNSLLWNVVKCWAFVGSSNYPWTKYRHDVDASGETVENGVPCQRTSHRTTYTLKFPQVWEFVIIFLTVNHIKLHFPLKTSTDVASVVLRCMSEGYSSSLTCRLRGRMAEAYAQFSIQFVETCRQWGANHSVCIFVSSCQFPAMESI